MPVSHLGLTVSHIPSATSFYLSALQPLGYHFIGHQGDSIGLGIHDADFFLTQQSGGARISPTHIAFAADGRLAVRDCYAAALSAGGQPSGAPTYRNSDCSCFNAAVTDLDGNTIEFIFREAGVPCEDGETAPSENSRVLTWQQDMADSSDETSEASFDSKLSVAKSRAQTALDLASSSSRSVRSEAPSVGITHTRTVPFGMDTKAIIGTVLGAAAGAAIAFAMVKSEQDSKKEEKQFAASIASRDRGRDSRTVRDDRTIRDDKSVRSARRSASAAPARTVHRNFSVTESAHSLKYPPPPTTVMRAIEPAGHDDDTEIQEVLSRYTLRRPKPARSQTCDALEYATASVAPKSVAAASRFSAKRSATLPQEPPQYLLEGPKSVVSSMPPSIYSKAPTNCGESDESRLRRHDSGVSMRSHRSRRSGDDKRSSASTSSTIKPSRRASTYESAAEVPLPASKPASVVPSKAPSKAPSRHESICNDADDRRSSTSKTSTLRPSRRESTYESAANLPLPASKPSSVVPSKAPSSVSTAKPPRSESRARSYALAKEVPLPDSRAASYISAAQQALPASRAASYVSAKVMPSPGSRAASYISAAERPLPASRAASYTSAARDLPLPMRAGSYTSAAGIALPGSLANDRAYEDDEAVESDGMDDARTVFPEDSISCVGLPAPARSSHSEHGRSHHSEHGKSHHSGSKHSSKRSHHSSSSRRDEEHHSHHSRSSRREREKDGDGTSEGGRSASTVKPAKSKVSAATLPVRGREREGIEKSGKSGKRSVFSFT